MYISFDGIDEQVISFIAPDGLAAGDVVCMVENKTVAMAGENQSIAGVCISARNGVAGVLTRGVVTLSYTGDGIEPGFCYLAADVTGRGVKKGCISINGTSIETVGREYLVLDVDEAAKTVTFML